MKWLILFGLLVAAGCKKEDSGPQEIPATARPSIPSPSGR